MYPLVSWKYSELCARLHRLIENDFLQEAAIGATQTIEQAFKRILKHEMSKRRISVDEKKRLVEVELLSIEQRDNALLNQADSIPSIKSAWRILIPNHPLDKIVDVLVHPGAWMALINDSESECTIQLKGAKHQLPCGLRGLRNSLIHGTHSPPLDVIHLLSQWSIQAVELILHPSNGVVRFVNWDPFDRSFPFRERKQ